MVAGTGHAGWPLDRRHVHGLAGEARVRIWRLLGAALAVPVMLGGLVLVTAGPAAACTCVQMTEAQHAASANAVFVGALVDSRDDGIFHPFLTVVCLMILLLLRRVA